MSNTHIRALQNDKMKLQGNTGDSNLATFYRRDKLYLSMPELIIYRVKIKQNGFCGLPEIDSLKRLSDSHAPSL